MNYLVQRGKVRGQMINVPEGLPDLLSDITREVLRCQPTTECLCQFIIDYLHSVIVTREKSLAAKAIIDQALKSVNEIIGDMCICHIDKVKSEEMALAMEDCFRRFLEKRRCATRHEKEIIKFEESDMLDEMISRCHFSEDELMITRPMIEEAYNRFVAAYMKALKGTDGTDALYQYFMERDRIRAEIKQRHEAAVRIQASFRGFMVRKSIFQPVEESVKESTSEDFYIRDSAARKIQQFFRSYQFRKSQLLAASICVEPPVEVCTPKSVLSLEALSPEAAKQKLRDQTQDESTSEVIAEEVPAVASTHEDVAETEAAEDMPESPPEEAPPVEEPPKPEPVEAEEPPAPEPQPQPQPEPEPEPEPAAAPEPEVAPE